MTSVDSFEADNLRDAFARLFAQHDRWLRGYLCALLGNMADAEEVFQEVCVVLWREHTKFQPGTSFAKWASVVALHQVQRFRRERRRTVQQLSDTTIELIARDAVERTGLLDARRDALRSCLAKLPSDDQELVRVCYADASHNFKIIAEQLGKPTNTVYKALQRIRRVLFECIERTLATEGRTL